jgi:SAM-dependent methyltransferase
MTHGDHEAERAAAVEAGYRQYHAPRHRFLLRLVQEHLPAGARRVLDVGPSPLTDLLRRHLACPVDTLGLQPAERHEGGDHHHADLNHPEALPGDLPSYDLVVFAEVLEHLHTSPTPVLGALSSVLTEGGLLLLQTPNAASLPKRIKLLLGKNPYDLIREERDNPGHFREYTLAELKRYAQQGGFEVVAIHRKYYFDARHAHHHGTETGRQALTGALKNLLYRTLPPFLREGITLVLRNSGEATRSHRDGTEPRR